MRLTVIILFIFIFSNCKEEEPEIECTGCDSELVTKFSRGDYVYLIDYDEDEKILSIESGYERITNPESRKTTFYYENDILKNSISVYSRSELGSFEGTVYKSYNIYYEEPYRYCYEYLDSVHQISQANHPASDSILYKYIFRDNRYYIDWKTDFSKNEWNDYSFHEGNLWSKSFESPTDFYAIDYPPIAFDDNPNPLKIFNDKLCFLFFDNLGYLSDNNYLGAFVSNPGQPGQGSTTTYNQKSEVDCFGNTTRIGATIIEERLCN